MGFFSASFVSIPVSLLAHFWQRSFVDAAGKSRGGLRRCREARKLGIIQGWRGWAWYLLVAFGWFLAQFWHVLVARTSVTCFGYELLLVPHTSC